MSYESYLANEIERRAERRCSRCRDVTDYLSSDDLCDGCVEEEEAADDDDAA